MFGFLETHPSTQIWILFRFFKICTYYWMFPNFKAYFYITSYTIIIFDTHKKLFRNLIDQLGSPKHNACKRWLLAKGHHERLYKLWDPYVTLLQGPLAVIGSNWPYCLLFTHQIVGGGVLLETTSWEVKCFTHTQLWEPYMDCNLGSTKMSRMAFHMF